MTEKEKREIQFSENKKIKKIKFGRLVSQPIPLMMKLNPFEIKKEFIKPIRRKKRQKSSQQNISKIMNLVSEGLSKKVKKILNLHRQFSFDSDSLENDQKMFDKAIQIFKYGPSNYNEIQTLMKFLYKLQPFNQIFSESDYNEIKTILQNLANHLKYKCIKKNKIICRYGQNVENFYLILKGSINVLVPNEEQILMTEEEYFRYLINLRILNENYILRQVMAKNYLTFVIEENNIDDWIRTAFNTLEFLNENDYQNDKNNNFQSKNSSNKSFNKLIRRKTSYLKKSRTKKKISGIKVPLSPGSKKQNIINSNDTELEKKKIFNTLEKKNLVYSLKELINVAMKIIEPHNPDLIGINVENYISKDLSTEEYINRIKPLLYNYKLNELKKPVKIITYFIAHSLKTGNKFGDMTYDLNGNRNNEKYNTIITIENCDFGVLNRLDYTKCLREITEKTRKKKIRFLLSLSIFLHCNQNSFGKNFDSYFSKRLVYFNEKLFNEGDEPNNNKTIYFIRNGEFCSSCYRSIYDIHNLFIDLNYKNLIDNEDEDDCLNKETDSYIKFKKRKNQIKIQFFKENDIMGLNDCIHEGKYIYTLTCSSQTATVYEIHNNFFKLILNSDPKIKENVEYEEVVKRNLTVKLLLKYINDKIKYYQYYSKGGDILKFGCLTSRKDNNDSLRLLLEKREMAKRGEYFYRSIHKKKINLVIDKSKELYDKKPDLFCNKKKKPILNLSEDEEFNKKKSRNKLTKTKNILLPIFHNLNNKNEFNEDGFTNILTNKLIKKSTYKKPNENNSTYYSFSNRKSNIGEKILTERKKDFSYEKYFSERNLVNNNNRRDNTILPICNINEKMRRTKLILKRIPNFLSTESSLNEKKNTIFNITNKTLYKYSFN